MSINPRLTQNPSEKITPNGTTTYTYGTPGELKEVQTQDQTITYLHNALNQRTAKLIDGVIVEKCLWANLTTLLAIYDRENNLIQRFEYADQRMPISMSQNNQKYYLHYDQAGTLKAITQEDGIIVKQVTYDTFGNVLSDSNPNFKVPFGFAGGLYDSDTKLTRFGYRDYDSYTGKWTAKDPIDFNGGDTNLYGYVLGDPVNFVDVDGLAKSGWDKFWEWWGGEGTDDMREKSYCIAYKSKGTAGCDLILQASYPMCSPYDGGCKTTHYHLWDDCCKGKLKCK